MKEFADAVVCYPKPHSEGSNKKVTIRQDLHEIIWELSAHFICILITHCTDARRSMIITLFHVEAGYQLTVSAIARTNQNELGITLACLDADQWNPFLRNGYLAKDCVSLARSSHCSQF